MSTATDFPQGLGAGNPSDTVEFLQELTNAVLASTVGSSPLFGSLAQAAAPLRPARSNADITGTASLLATNKLVAAGGEATVIAVPVVPGDLISKILVPIGTTAGEKVEEGYAALFEGKEKGKLLAQSKGKAYAEEFKKEEGFVFTLEKVIEVTAENCPGGFIYVEINLNTVTVIPTVVSTVGPTAGAMKALALSGTGKPPQQLAAKSGAGRKQVAPAELEALVNIAYVPIIALF